MAVTGACSLRLNGVPVLRSMSHSCSKYSCQLLRVHGVSFFVDVDEVGTRTGLADGFGGGDEGVGNGDDHVAGLHAGGDQSEAHGIRAAGHANAVFRVAKGGEFIFEIFDHRAADEAGGADNLLEYGGQLLLEFFVRA